MAINEQKQTLDEFSAQDDWSLDTDQMIFMLQHHNMIETAFEVDDMESLRELASSPEFTTIFGDMSFDEAYDRYETMLEEGKNGNS